METSNTQEQAFEWLIERNLVGSTREERKVSGLTDVDAQHPEATHYYWGQPKDMNSKLAIDLRRLWLFLKATQQDELDRCVNKEKETQIPQRINKAISTYGIIKVLREGVDFENIHLTLFYPKPSPADSAASHEKYAQNQFSLTRQQTFSLHNPGDEIDMVLFVNGLPLFTFELKNPWTHQTARNNGEKQYKEDRDPKEPLLMFGCCLAHFTMDKDEVYFTTKLDGGKTYFMPFNQGQPNGQGAGNPVNPNGYKTSYMWEKILQKDIVSDIIMNYSLFDYGEAKTGKKVPHTMKNAKKLIFPRFHQLDVVTKLIDDVSVNGVGKTYLIQHSAGSGKSNSITWLAYKIIKACPVTMDAKRAKDLDMPLFNSAIVVTDRRLLDKQITDNIKAFGQSGKIIAHADNSNELKGAIEDGKRIIITTIQKFPLIYSSISDVSGHNFAIIIDEAHSSQSGSAADKMNMTVQKDADTNGGDTDELLEKLMKDRKMSTNCSYFAFTATPKKETLERFGTKDAEGKFHPFHLYSMKQAIEEGFILDVIVNYTTYRSYYELVKSAQDNPEYKTDKAQKILRRAVESDPQTIAAKADVMLSHFDTNVYRAHKLKGKAKAMVVTKDIECAIRYYQELTKLKKQKKLSYNILIAFSDKKTVDGVEYTEAGLNGFPEKDTAEEFDKDTNKILVVANKYLTGFDQPKLCAMYIDKPLDGVLAVQALSRLNRAAPELGKRAEDIFILDFYNTTDDMKDAFDPFYTSTTLSQATDVNVLNDLKDTLLDIEVFTMDDVNAFIELYIHGEEADKWSPIIDRCAERFEHDIEWPDNGKADFKIKCKQFVKVYSRVAAIIPYEVADWEKMFWFLRFLIPELHVPTNTDDMKDLLDNVDLSTYGLRRTKLNETIELDKDETVVDPTSPSMAGAGGVDDPKEKLTEILNAFNNRWFNDWPATPEDQKAKFVSLSKGVVEDPDYQNLVEGNPDEQAVQQILYNIIDRQIRQHRKADNGLYLSYQKDEAFKADFRNTLIRMVNNQDYL